MAENKAEQPKKKGLKRLLIGGLLTAVAAGVFVSSSGLRGTANEAAFQQLPDAQSQNLSIQQEGDTYPALTKDNKMIRVNMELKALASGSISNTTGADFQEHLTGQGMMALMGEVNKYNAAELPANIANIQQAVSARLAQLIPVGMDGGKIAMAKEGVNFAAPKITKITDGTGETTLWQLPSSNPIARGLGL